MMKMTVISARGNPQAVGKFPGFFRAPGHGHSHCCDCIDTHLSIHSNLTTDPAGSFFDPAMRRTGCFAEGLITQSVPLNNTIEVNGQVFQH